ncbi:hypothetical protein GCM10007231_14320 [Nocardioides daphniae]|uniref:Uncharacterized protein n=1 Tax=Nocardioides daphniae TaxID=402297 RepID=A0ABQ1Q6Z6_9ACTN|nr:hypothetical protein GCM10007231_14320 [Nocardioides daphniae]
MVTPTWVAAERPSLPVAFSITSHTACASVQGDSATLSAGLFAVLRTDMAPSIANARLPLGGRGTIGMRAPEGETISLGA